MKSFVLGISLLLVASSLFTPAARADDSATGGRSTGTTAGQAESNQIDGNSDLQPSPFGGRDTGQEAPDVTISRTGVKSAPPAAANDAATPVNVAIEEGTGVPVDQAEADTSDGPTCAEYQPGELSDDGSFSYSGFCVKRRVCGSERVDDVVSGRIVGTESTGRYRDYLDLVGEFIVSLNESFGDPSAPVSAQELETRVNSVSDVLIERGLQDSPVPDLLPVFYWCANLNVDGTFDPVGSWDTSFEWDLAVGDVYNIDDIRARLYAEVTAELDLYKPDIGLVPHTELGYTFLKVPTWLFVQNPLDEVHRYATNDTGDLDTLRVDLKATVLNVQWSFAGETITTCAPEDMKIFDRETSDQIEDMPECHYRFPDIGYSDLTATVRYKIQEQVRTRQSSTLHDYPADNWTDYLGVETIIELTSNIPGYEIHAIYSLNIAPGVSGEEAIARAKANGEIPPLPNLDTK